ncbi:DNA polymerase III, delta'' subunit [Thioflavicoccus mobilis 8321]|uniref:DNA polymerase III subunit delta' n=1 Tax=Thioflavicoccus mobilis 8321 TaxID=765912 RepID=L0H0F0_9GAMM|nr:DNA polymerase III subunit delta' [Thioflavicoccus mobilis]AGA91110.1 DNA polymerase III, delta'' subunit [Thioflavicoccus mobilis 8321]
MTEARRATAADPSPGDERCPPPWLQPVWAVLTQARVAGRLPHALLISGPTGIGKRRLATAFVDALLCSAPGSDQGVNGGACGRCADCHLLAVGNHPDRLAAGPDPEAKSNEIRVDAIRELIDREGLTPHRGRRKVVVIDPAHQLNRAAANSLLKTLEEPAPTTLLVLIAEEPNRLPATIRSRCQRLALSPPSESAALEWLAGRVGDRDPRRLLHLAHGAPLRALDYLADGRLERHETLFEGFHGVLAGRRDPVTEARGWIELDPALSCEWLAGWVSDLLRLTADPACDCLIDLERHAVLKGLAQGLEPAPAHRYLQRVFEARGQVDSTINKQLLFESLLIGLAGLRGSGA